MEVIAAGWLSVADAARAFDYNIEYVRQLVRAGNVRAKRVARMIYVDRSSLAAYRRDKGTEQSRGALRSTQDVPIARATAAEVLRQSPYFKNLAIRQARNQAAITLLDRLCNGDADDRAEQKRVGAILEKAYLAERPHLKKPA